MSRFEKTVIDIESEDSPGPSKMGRRSDGGTYLLVADDSAEFELAMRYAVRVAQARRGHIALAHVINVEEFQHWGTVESRMRKELREQAEKFIWGVAKKVHDISGFMSSLYIEEGKPNDVITGLIEQDDNIVRLILGAGVSSGGPGPMVSYFTGKGISRLRVPLVLVPGHIDIAHIDDIA